MLRDAINEIRLHPGRFLATLVAIAISVGFVAAISVVINTEQRALSQSQDLNLSRADVVVSVDSEDTANELLPQITGTPGVSEVMITVSTTEVFASDEGTASVTVYTVPDPAFIWADLTAGRWPTAPDEVVLAQHVLDQLGTAVGESLDNSFSGQRVTVVGSTADPRSLAGGVGYVPDITFGTTFLAIQTEGEPAAVVEQLSDTLPGTVSVQATQDYYDEMLEANTFGIEIFKYLLYVFAAIALVVGIIIISNTFTILVTQRRRQIALLRAVGASSGQVRGRLILEAIIIGLVGSAMGVLLGMGVAVLAGLYTGSLYWGLVLDPTELGVAVGVGVLVTFLSVLGPSLTATTVPPVEALQPVPAEGEVRRASAARGAFCVVLGLGGAGLVVYSRIVAEWQLVWAILGAILLSFALLIGAVLYIPPLLRLLGGALGFAGPTVTLAAKNAARNPRRTAATSVALMLAVGLVITLQVAISTTRSTAVGFLEEMYPVDMIISPLDGAFDEAELDRVRAMPAVHGIGVMPTKQAQLDSYRWTLIDANEAISELGIEHKVPPVERGSVVVLEGSGPSQGRLHIDGVNGSFDVAVVEVPYLGWQQGLLHTDDFAAVPDEAVLDYAWVELAAGATSDEIAEVILALEGVRIIDGAAVISTFIEQLVDVLMLILSALLGVAVLIALVGVANTLGLSVLERQRESALLRALGMQRSSLRLMLLAEALMIAGLAVVIGLAGGAFFGWLGVSSTMSMINAELTEEIPVRFSIDPVWTLGLLLICVAAAALASVLPGRRASRATPTEALATD